MLNTVDNKTAYSTTDFDCWAYAEQPLPEELFLLERFFDKAASTLEAGTGGGRILYYMEDMGFTDLRGFDYIKAFIDEAIAKRPETRIRFEVQDATSLPYAADSYEQLIYLGQVLCFIEDEGARNAALREAHRILKPGGTAIFSFLSYDVRRSHPAYAMYFGYIRLLRKLTGSVRPAQSISRLKLGDRINLRALADAGPHAYWYRHDEIRGLLQDAGFQVKGVGTSQQLLQQRICDSFDDLAGEPTAGMLYIACSK